MADFHKMTFIKPARLLQSYLDKKSAPPTAPNAEPKFSAEFGIEKEDMDAAVALIVPAIKKDFGSFTKADDYQIAVVSGAKAAQRVLDKAVIECRGKSQDEAMKIQERAEAQAEVYRQYAGILRASSKFDVGLARLANGKIIDIPNEEHARVTASRDYFYRGAFVVAAVSFQTYNRKKVEDKDGVTCYLENVLFVRKGEALGGGGRPANSQVFGGFAAGYSEIDPLANAPSTDDGFGGSTEASEDPAF